MKYIKAGIEETHEGDFLFDMSTGDYVRDMSGRQIDMGATVDGTDDEFVYDTQIDDESHRIVIDARTKQPVTASDGSLIDASGPIFLA